eukprot:5952667-Prymnesium_polylepis.1
MQHGCWVLQIRYAPRPKAKQADMKWARSTDVGYNQTWATREAATAAKAHFKAWVENSRNAQQRAASEASVIARAAAVTAAREKPPLPVRFRGGLRLESATVGVKLQVGKGAAVAVVLETVRHASETLLLRYKDRSAQVIDRAKRRRDAADAAARCIPESIWDDFFERCAKAARRAESQPSAAQPALKPRGKSRARQIGLRRQHRSSAARREQQWARQRESIAAAHTVRVERIEQLRKALLSGNVVSLLRPDEAAPAEPDAAGGATEFRTAAAEAKLPAAPISLAQASRLTTQGWAVVRFYEELDAIELG